MSEAAGELTQTDGVRAVELARNAVESFVENGTREQLGSMRDAFYLRTGAFVRLENTHGRGRLRGCAGSYDWNDHLGEALVDAAIDAASEDSCGSGVDTAELSSICVSVCIVGNVVLTDDPLADLELGRHGVAVERGADSGWLYPTVPIENGWSAAEYLDRACRTTGLAPGAWEDDDTMVTLFEGRVFREREPEGSIQELDF
ncbi:TIGR00296 family protein [Halorientalis pallida]|uniref:TIGR00296 family protein n=1 Tax=Halorientalis pallida TaxID=2479928 RepID=A0A498KWZ5_9EURY|nr:TIGR00296 family protein [Halorientalis pallida]RXK47282.1 TIGR00296 family protein [Halorientalis pallida]